MTAAVLEDLTAQIAGKRVLCVGDLILDRFVYGQAARISREAPVAVIKQRHDELKLGACGNVARNVTALGGRATLLAVVGDDAEGHAVSNLLADGVLDDVELITARGRATPVKTRYIAGAQQMLCVDRDPDTPVGAEAEEHMLAAMESAVGECDVVVVSDYGRGVMTPQVIRRVIDIAAKAVKPVVASPRGEDFARYDGVYLLKPNVHDLQAEVAAPCDTDAEVAAAMAAVMARTQNLEVVLVTRGAKGMALLRRGHEPAFFSATPRDVYDISGAGDTAMAALALAVAAGAPLRQAINISNRAAGITVTKMGTATVTAEELIADAYGRAIAGAPITDIAGASDEVARWRAEGARIGVTNGCFDLLHAGHVAMLNRARSLCDRLVVGLNDDASVRRLKGEGRPVTPQTDRAWLVSALSAVDLVVIFSDDTATALLEAVRPDVYVKGGDYGAPDQLPEAETARAVGAELVFAPLTPERSTSAIIERLSR